MPRWFNKRICLMGITLACVVFFSPSLFNQFTNWDDQVLLTENPLVRNFSWESLRKIFDFHFITYYPPLTLLSFSLEHHFFHLSPFVYHLDNLILHTLNSCLVFILIYTLVKNLGIAFLTAVLFAVSPLRVESVAWVAQRKDVLFSFFFLLSMIAYLRKSFWPCFCFFVLSSLAKIQGLTLPFVLLIMDYFQSQQGGWRLWRSKWPFWVIGVLFSLLTIKGAWPNYSAIQLFSFSDKFFLSCFAFVLYLIKSFIPYQLCAIYPYPIKTAGVFPWFVYLSPLFVLLWVVLIIRQWKKSPTFVAGSLIFILNIILALQSVVSVGSFMNDRFTYLPSVGLYWIASCWVIDILKTQWKPIILTGITMYILLFGYLSFQHCKIWHDGISLWSDVIKQYPQLPFIYDNRGSSYVEKNLDDLAFKDFSKAIALNPSFASSYVNRAIIFDKRGAQDLARNDFNKAVELAPSYASAYFNRGIFHLRHQEAAEAKSDFQKAQILGLQTPENVFSK